MSSDDNLIHKLIAGLFLAALGITITITTTTTKTTTSTSNRSDESDKLKNQKIEAEKSKQKQNVKACEAYCDSTEDVKECNRPECNRNVCAIHRYSHSCHLCD